MHYICCVLYFSYYYTVIDNEIVMRFIIVQNQWETWACFPAVRWSHLGWWETVTPEVCCYVQSTLESHCCHCRKPCFTKIGCWKRKQAFQCLCGNLRLFRFDFNLWRFEAVSNILLRPLSFAILSSWSSYSVDKVDSPGLFTDRSWCHSFPVWGILWLGSNAWILSKAEIRWSCTSLEKEGPGSVSFNLC